MTLSSRGKERLHTLDALRGVAAFAVVLHHCLYTLPSKPRWVSYSPLRLIDAGGQGAVLIFFVLSGFVLYRALENHDRFDYLSYAARRIARIFLPFAAAICFSALLYWLADSGDVPNTSTWFNDSIWTRPATLRHVFEHLMVPDVPHDLNNVMWSLVHELRISLIFPLIAFAVAKNWKVACAVSFAFSTTAALIWWERTYVAAYDLLSTARYFFAFVAGASLCLTATTVKERYRSVHLIVRRSTWLMALALITIPERHVGGVVTSVAAIVIVALCYADTGAESILKWPPLAWLGRVSYSLYLVHLPIIAAMVHLLGDEFPLMMILALSVALSLLCAEISYRFVEAPSIRFGKRLARRQSDLA